MLLAPHICLQLPTCRVHCRSLYDKQIPVLSSVDVKRRSKALATAFHPRRHDAHVLRVKRARPLSLQMTRYKDGHTEYESHQRKSWRQISRVYTLIRTFVVTYRDINIARNKRDRDRDWTASRAFIMPVSRCSFLFFPHVIMSPGSLHPLAELVPVSRYCRSFPGYEFETR